MDPDPCLDLLNFFLTKQDFPFCCLFVLLSFMLKLDESFGNQEILLSPFSFVEIWVLRVKNSFFSFCWYFAS